MTFQQLKKLYIDYNHSSKKSDIYRAKGYATVIDAFQKLTDTNEYYDEVKISLVAENLLKGFEWLYKTTGSDEYRWQCKGIKDCIIEYATDIELSNALANYKGDLTENAIFNFINTTFCKDRTKYDSVHSLCNVMKLSL